MPLPPHPPTPDLGLFERESTYAIKLDKYKDPKLWRVVAVRINPHNPPDHPGNVLWGFKFDPARDDRRLREQIFSATLRCRAWLNDHFPEWVRHQFYSGEEVPTSIASHSDMRWYNKA